MESQNSPSPAPAPATESKAQEQARLRRERRNAKIQASGSERLSKITSMSGRPVAAEAELTKQRSGSPVPPIQPRHPAPAAEAPDPAEVDISQIQQQSPPSSNHDALMKEQTMFLQQLMRDGGRFDGSNGTSLGGSQQPQPGVPGHDPMVQLMQQMLGADGGPGQQGPTDGAEGIAAGFAEMFGGLQPPEDVKTKRADYIWRIVHTICSVALAMYVALTFTFTGSELGRLGIHGTNESSAPMVFWMFTTAELILQSSRYFMDGGKLPTSGLLGGLSRMLPNPYGNYIRLFSRYSIIYTTIMGDAMVIIFVLGCLAWWNGHTGPKSSIRI